MNFDVIAFSVEDERIKLKIHPISSVVNLASLVAHQAQKSLLISFLVSRNL